MASTIIHYVISKKIAELIVVDDVERFLFGATIAPDASSHEDGSYDRAHFQGWLSDGSRKGFDWNIFEQSYGEQFGEDSLYLGYCCHLMQDAMWFHDIVDKYVRIYPRDIRGDYYQMGYRDYKRLNYLLVKEYGLENPKFSEVTIPVKEVRQDRVQPVLEAFGEQFDAEKCAKADLEMYQWDIIIGYIEKCAEFCVQEIEAMRNGRERVETTKFYVLS